MEGGRIGASVCNYVEMQRTPYKFLALRRGVAKLRNHEIRAWCVERRCNRKNTPHGLHAIHLRWLSLGQRLQTLATSLKQYKELL